MFVTNIVTKQPIGGQVVKVLADILNDVCDKMRDPPYCGTDTRNLYLMDMSIDAAIAENAKDDASIVLAIKRTIVSGFMALIAENKFTGSRFFVSPNGTIVLAKQCLDEKDVPAWRKTDWKVKAADADVGDSHETFSDAEFRLLFKPFRAESD